MELTRNQKTWYAIFKERTYYETSIHSLGGGEWSIEVATEEDGCVIEYIGSNGQCFGETADPLWDWLEADQDAAAKFLKASEG